MILIVLHIFVFSLLPAKIPVLFNGKEFDAKYVSFLFIIIHCPISFNMQFVIYLLA